MGGLRFIPYFLAYCLFARLWRKSLKLHNHLKWLFHSLEEVGILSALPSLLSISSQQLTSRCRPIKTSKYSSIWLPGELLCRLLNCQQRRQNRHTSCRSGRKLFSGFLLHPKQFPKASHWTGTSFQTVSASSSPTRRENCGRFDAFTCFQITWRTWSFFTGKSRVLKETSSNMFPCP